MAVNLSEGFVDQLDAERRKVDVASHNFSVRELVRMMADDELNVAPSYQRQFRWDNAAQSVFIESVFLGLPVPPIFVATNVGFQWEVVDGVQRLSTLAHFMAEDDEGAQKVSSDGPLVLEGLEKLTDLNGSSYSDLPKNLKVYFGRQPLQMISLTDKSDLDVRFDVFERLNRGGIRLTPQEVRACIYRGPFNDFIEDLGKNAKLGELVKLQRSQKTDGTITEEVLKFFAYKNYQDMFDGRLEKFLNKSMQRAQLGFDYKNEKKVFEQAIDKLYEIVNGPFLRAASKVTPLVQFEACLIAIANLYADGIQPIHPPTGWLDDPELKNASGSGSNTQPMLTARIRRARELFSGRA